MKYYKLIYDYENDGDFIGSLAKETFGVDQYDVTKGELVKEWNENISFIYNPDEGDVYSDYLSNNYRWFIVSEKFQQEMEGVVQNSIQYLPIKIINSKNNEEELNYKVANVITVIDALDLDNSVYDIFELDDEKIFSIEKYGLKKDIVDGYNIFKLKDDTIPIFVSEKFKNTIDNSKMTGFEFLEVKVI
jgi:hypothetical protein